MRKLILITALLFPFLSLRSWLECRDFGFIYHFSAYDLELQIIDAIRADSGSILEARFFHNKVTFFLLDLYKRYTELMDINLLVSMFSLVGLFGVILGAWYFLRSKKSLKNLVLFAIFPLSVLIEVLLNPKVPFIFTLLSFAGPLLLISFYGHSQFIKKIDLKLLSITYFVFLLLSLMLLISYPQAAYTYCSIQ